MCLIRWRICVVYVSLTVIHVPYSLAYMYSVQDAALLWETSLVGTLPQAYVWGPRGFLGGWDLTYKKRTPLGP